MKRMAKGLKLNNICTIYKLINKINNKIYIGQTWRSLEERWGLGNRYNEYLSNSIKKHGKENFYYETLTFCGTQESANYCEDYFIKKFNSQDSEYGYNIRDGGSKGKLSEETKKKVSKSLMGHIVTEETKKRQSEARMGVEPWNKGTVGIMKPNSGSFKSGERKSKNTEFKKGQLPWNTGKKYTAEQLRSKKKLTFLQEEEIRNHLKLKTKKWKDISKEYDICFMTISNIKNNKHTLNET